MQRMCYFLHYCSCFALDFLLTAIQQSACCHPADRIKTILWPITRNTDDLSCNFVLACHLHAQTPPVQCVVVVVVAEYLYGAIKTKVTMHCQFVLSHYGPSNCCIPTTF